MGGQNTENAVDLAERLFSSACLITGDAHCAERLALDTLRKESVTQPAWANAHALVIGLYRRLVRCCLFTASNYSAGQSPIALELKALGKLSRTAVVLRYFLGFNQATAAKILGMPQP